MSRRSRRREASRNPSQQRGEPTARSTRSKERASRSRAEQRGTELGRGAAGRMLKAIGRLVVRSAAKTMMRAARELSGSFGRAAGGVA